ncbi:MAG: AbrB/MazE/SpoVT family DNA-binding domain-containing protein [Clostridiales bacterium]|nr:AbrB/MazE/SpoVT family DNA-binding domain-containing protein [Clostridiales bacterium]
MLEKEGKYIFGVCKIGEKGQIVIPKDARKIYNLSAGDTLLMLGDAKGMALIKTEFFQDLAEGILNDKK